MDSGEIRKKFLDFFKERGHRIVPSSSLIPDDPSVLLTTAGMQQFKPYFLGKADPVKDLRTRRTTSIQKSFRTSDIDEVGDESHLTFFEMLGHFSFGDYFKKETIEWTHELLTDIFGIEPERISATVFAGDPSTSLGAGPSTSSGQAIPFDRESYDAWLRFLPEERIRKGDRAGNVWGPPGGAGSEGPCGAANEVYVDDLEVATLVFMEYNCARDGGLSPLPQKGVDVGWGLERLAMILQKKKSIFETDLFTPLVALLPENLTPAKKRVAADHLRASAFLAADGVRPSNKEAGYILRRLMRRVLAYEKTDSAPSHIFDEVLHAVPVIYGGFYPELVREKAAIREEFKKEREKFVKTLERGLKEIEKLTDVTAAAAFNIYQSFGVTFEIIKEVGGNRAKGLTRSAFDEEFKKHQEISRRGTERKFGGHGLILDTGELKAGSQEELNKVLRLHTATHLLQQALREVLGPEVRQMGSDITAERTRFDFTFPRKTTEEEKKEVEALVNKKIKEDLPVQFVELPKAEAEKVGALYFFKEKYPAVVKVYYVGRDLKSAWSKEFCGGPHVTRTGLIGNFKIVKEESVGAGMRRIRGAVGD